jgi:HlyD family secretion protein
MKTNFVKHFLAPLFCLLILSCSNTKTGDASGTFEAVETIISSETAGKIIQLTINEGDELKTGELVAIIDSIPTYLNKLQLIQTQKAILSGRPGIQAQLETLRKELENANSDVIRFENLVKNDVASQKQLDDAKTRVEVLKARIEAQENILNTTTSNLTEQANTINIQLQQNQNQLSKCRILNPVNGTVLLKYAEANEMTAPGKPLYKIADLSELILRAYISGDQLAKVKLNQKVLVKCDDGAGGFKEHQGTVIWINPKAEFTPKTIQTKNERANLVYAIKIKVKNDGTIKIGMYAEVNL